MKTGKTDSSGDYHQQANQAINFANWDSTSASGNPEFGQVRFNKDTENLEVMTRTGWQRIMTQDQLSDDPDGKLKDGIAEKMQTAKKTGLVGIYTQGTTNAGGLDDYLSMPGGGAMPNWMDKVTSDASDNLVFRKQLTGEGTHVYLLQQVNGARTGFGPCTINIHAHRFLGIPDADKYNWRYFAFGGINGYNTIVKYGSIIGQNIDVYPNWPPPSPDQTPVNDTSPHYGRFRATIDFTYGPGACSKFNSNYTMMFVAKKFKGFG